MIRKEIYDAFAASPKLAAIADNPVTIDSYWKLAKCKGMQSEDASQLVDALVAKKGGDDAPFAAIMAMPDVWP